MINPLETILDTIVFSFGDPKGIDIVVHQLTGKKKDDPDLVGMGMHVDEMIISHLEGFSTEVLDKPDGEFYHLKNCDFVDKYLYYFDVKPMGPDVMKFIGAFGWSFERYAGALGERHLVTSVIRGLTVRLLRNAATMSNSRQEKPPAVMVDKVYKLSNDADRSHEMLGQYGPYMLFKTWALG